MSIQRMLARKIRSRGYAASPLRPEFDTPARELRLGQK
jgi:hypothetical protein